MLINRTPYLKRNRDSVVWAMWGGAMASKNWRASRKAWIADIVFGGVAAAAIFTIGLASSLASDALRWDAPVIVICIGAALTLVASRRLMAWLMRRIRARVGQFLNARAQARGVHALTRVVVIDGDTIDDGATSARYRVANIDAPETDDRARCAVERAMGERAKAYAGGIFAKAREVRAHPTGRLDRYGRVVAFIVVDDKDFGAIMIERGFACAWTGQRLPWCGANGALRRLAYRRLEAWTCACGHAPISAD